MDCPYGKRVARRLLGKTAGSAVTMRPHTGHCPRLKLRAMRWLRPKCCNAATHRTLPGVQVLMSRRRDLLLHFSGAPPPNADGGAARRREARGACDIDAACGK
jgi:hypothetical protein